MTDLTEVTYVNETTFQAEVLKSGQPVLVDFTATWCGPCKLLDPILRQIAQEWSGKLKVVKIDVDQSPEIASAYGVMGVPTLMLFSAGEPRSRLTGYQPKDRILGKLLGNI